MFENTIQKVSFQFYANTNISSMCHENPSIFILKGKTKLATLEILSNETF